MILTANHVLVNEICKEQGVAMSNFSPLSSDINLTRSDSVIKIGTTTVIDKKSNELPKYIKELANKTEYTNLEGLMMFSELKEEYYLTEKQVKKIGSISEVCSKKFVKLNDDVIETFSNSNWAIYPVSKDEIEETYMKDLISLKQFKQIDEKTFLVWY